MLPDFPETKRLFSRFFRTYMRRKVREVSPYGAVQTRYLHEGRAMKITRADQSESTSGMEQLSVHLEIKFDEIENLTLQKPVLSCSGQPAKICIPIAARVLAEAREKFNLAE